MDIIENKVWAAQPDITTVCRCCLSANGNWDLITPYTPYTNEGCSKEVLAEMLEERFQISLSLLSEEGASRLICNMCYGRLRDAYYFRQQILNSEHRFVEYYINKHGRPLDSLQGNTEYTMQEIKLEIKVEPVDVLPEPSESDEETMSNIETTENHITEPINEHLRTNDGRIESTNTDSDAHAMKTSDEEVENETNQANSENSESKSCKPTAGKSKIKESKRNLRSATTDKNRLRRENIAVTLQHSTVVPFRVLHNTNKKYTCHYCYERYSIFDDLRKHYNKKHSKVTGDEIMASLTGPIDVVKAEISEIGCKICDQTFKTLEDLVKHLSKVHKKVYHRLKNEPSHGILGFVLDSDEFICHKCKKEFNVFKHLLSHSYEHYYAPRHKSLLST